MNAISQRNTHQGLAATRALATLYGVVRQDAWQDKLNACRNALADRNAAIEAAWRERTGPSRERACLDAQAAYDTSIAAAREEYEATTEAAWNGHDIRRVA